MLRENDPLETIQSLISERYDKSAAVFWAGSVSRNQGTVASDLDLIIVFPSIECAYREAFIYKGWPVDAFIHDQETLLYFFEDSQKNSGIPGLLRMVLEGKEVKKTAGFSEQLKEMAEKIWKEGPAAFTQADIDKERFLITDVLEDIEFAASRGEQLASAIWIHQALAQFYFRGQGKWCASGKSSIRFLKEADPQLALEFNQSFEDLFQHSQTSSLKKLTEKILKPYGGLFWDGFYSKAPQEARKSI